MSTEANNRTLLGLSPPTVQRHAEELLNLLFDAGMNTEGGTTQLHREVVARPEGPRAGREPHKRRTA